LMCDEESCIGHLRIARDVSLVDVDHRPLR
jgi:hypothetical protein